MPDNYDECTDRGMTYRSSTIAILVLAGATACQADPPEVGQDLAPDSATAAPATAEAVLSSGCTPDDPQRIPRIDVAGPNIELVLPPAMAETLERYAPGFVARPLTTFDRRIMDDVDFGCDNQPSAVLADFNGDGEPDLAVLGLTRSESLLAILVSEPDGYRYIERDRRQLDPSEAPDPNYFIDLVEPGRYTTRYEPEDPTLEPSAGDTYVLNLTHAAIGWGYFEKAAGILYWRDGRFREFATAD